MTKFVIIGGGIAGLSAANYLADFGMKPLLIEADTFGRHKVCGEFFSPEAVGTLEQWDVPLRPITKGHFITHTDQYTFDFPHPAGSISRALCEEKLSQRAMDLGVELLTQTRVMHIKPATNYDDNYVITLTSGEIITCKTVIIATGKIPGLSQDQKREPSYIGIKAHFKNIPMHDTLHLYISHKAYMGLSGIENNYTNISCLAAKTVVDQYATPQDFIMQLINSYDHLSELFTHASLLYDDWLITPVYQFGQKKTPDWPNAYFIGDAAATTYPATGNGLAMALTSGVLAAQHVLHDAHRIFQREWKKRYQQRLRWASWLHAVFTRPAVASHAFKVAHLFPALATTFYQKTRT